MMPRIITALLLVCFMVGCSVNPVTGKRNLNFYGEEWELNVGKQMYAPMRQSQGGDYQLDPELTAYVNEVGQRVAAQSARKLPYEFKVLNNGVPNAWALPGGKIVINRGLLSELQSEAELAAVLGHEIVHADAKHGARQQSKGMFTQVAMIGAMIYGSSKAKTQAGQQVATMVPQLGAALVTSKYGRDAERESDLYGTQYMAKAGYDPKGAVELQETFVRLSEGRNQNWMNGLFASHPPSRERVENNRKTAAELPAGGDTGRARYQQKMAYLTRVKPAYDAYDEAQKAMAEKNTDAARRHLQKALRIEPREAQFYALAGDIHLSNKDHRAAESQYSQSLKLNNDFFYYWLRRGQARHELQQFAAAKADLEKSEQLLPTEQAKFLLGNIEQASGNLQRAQQYYSAILGTKSNSQTARLAQTEMMKMAPTRYLQVAAQIDRNGTVYGVVNNPTPVAVGNLVLEIAYIDDTGRVHNFTRQHNTIVQPNQQAAVNLGFKLPNPAQLNQRVRVKIGQARAMQRR